jgi:hypothetical protein
MLYFTINLWHTRHACASSVTYTSACVKKKGGTKTPGHKGCNGIFLIFGDCNLTHAPAKEYQLRGNKNPSLKGCAGARVPRVPFIPYLQAS